MWSSVSLIALALCVPIFRVQRVFGQECKFVLENGIEIPNEYGFTLPIIQDIEKPGKVLLMAEAHNVTEIIDVSWINTRKYMEPVLNDTSTGRYLLLKLTDEFTDYEENEFSKTTSITVTFSCVAGTRKIEFLQPIEDTNNHSPVFDNAPYIYELPMPFPKNFALDKFAPISARDIDFTNTMITFNLDPSITGFSVSWLSSDSTDRKRHYATLVTTAIINRADDLTFNLYATDMGVPPRTSNTTVTIKVDRENSILRFTRPLYIANLTTLTSEEADGKVIPFGEVGLEIGADETVEYRFQDELSDYKNNFQLITNTDHSAVTFRLTKPSEKMFRESFILLSLMANKSGAVETTILHISLPGKNRENCLSSLKECDECDECEYLVATIVLSILLVVFAVGLIVSVIMNWRHWRKQNIKHKDEQQTSRGK